MSKVSLGHATAIKDSGSALLVEMTEKGRRKQRWIPQSQIHDDSEVYSLGQSGKLIVTEWWAGKNGFT